MQQRGVTIWFTGLSGAGKSTIAGHLSERLRMHGLRVEVLDGDEVRTNLSKGLGFSKEDRDTHILRVAYVAHLLTRHGVAVIVPVISPYRAIRAQAREMIRDFLEVHVNAPLAVCEARDVKGLYARARAGEIREFTGIDDPYEPPEDPDVECRTDQETPEESAQKIVDALVEKGLLDPH